MQESWGELWALCASQSTSQRMVTWAFQLLLGDSGGSLLCLAPFQSALYNLGQVIWLEASADRWFFFFSSPPPFFFFKHLHVWLFTLGQLKQIEYEYGAGLPVASAKSALMSSVLQLPEEHTEITALPLPPGKQRAKAEVYSQTQGE